MASTSHSVSVVSDYSLMSSQRNSADNASSNATKDDSNDLDLIKHKFYEQLVEYDANHSGSNRKPWTQERILEVIADLKNIRVTMKKKSVDYYWISKYDVISTASEEYLISKKKHPAEPTVRIVAREQYFDLLSEVHTSCGHGGRDKMLQDLKSKFYIPKKAVEIFVSLCPVCESKRSVNKNDNFGRLANSRKLNEGGQFDLIDFQTSPDGEYKWLLYYQNIGTKYTILRPLKTMSSMEIASELLITFLTLGAPLTLQSDLGTDFTLSVLEELATLWPDCNITVGTQYNAQQDNKEIKTLLQSWMSENNSKNWSFGCFYVQYFKNTTFHRALGKLPFEALFGRLPKTGFISSSILTNSIIEQTQQEQENSSSIKLEIKVERSSPDHLDTENDIEPKLTSESDYDSSDAYQCKSCKSTNHVISGIIDDSQGQRLKVSCYVCKSAQDMEFVRNYSLKRAAEEIDEISNKMPTFDVGNSVFVDVPRAHRGPLNTKTIKGKIVDFKNGVYRIATKTGTIKNWFSRRDLQLSETDYGYILESPATLDEVVASQPDCSKEFQRCNCKPALNQCRNHRCVCFKNKVLCGLKCHQKITCVNC